MSYYDHRLGLLALTLLGLPFALTFLLIALVGLASACLLLGHIGALLSQILQLILPIPILTTYLTALASHYSLLIATTLAGGLAGMWIYFSIQYNDLLAQYRNLGMKFQFPTNPLARIAGYVRKEIVEELQQSPGNNNEDIDIDIAVDDRTVIHSPVQDTTTENTKPELSDSNPFIRRISPQPLRNTDYDSLSHLHSTTPLPRLRPTANSFEFSPKMQYRSQQKGLRPTANVFEFTPNRQSSGVEGGCVSEWDEGSGRWVWQQQHQQDNFVGGERFDGGGFVREYSNGNGEFDDDDEGGAGIAGSRGFKAHFS